MSVHLFIVDVEASAPTPVTGYMTEFGVVDFLSRDWFHGHLWDFTPDPDVPALPVPTRRHAGWTTYDGRGLVTNLGTEPDPAVDDVAVFTALISWMAQRTKATRSFSVFVSDNPAFDFMWMACGFAEHDLGNPFGHSARRIGDLAAGLAGDWRQTSAWKRLRETGHDHNPVNDALGNAEALAVLLSRHHQR